MKDDSPRPSLQDASTMTSSPMVDFSDLSQHHVDILIHESKWKDDLSFDFHSVIHKCFAVTVQDIVKSKAIFELSILLTNDAESQKLNQAYRQQDKPTNVLSFESGEPIQHLAAQHQQIIAEEGAQVLTPKAIPLGDIALSYETLLRESQEQNKTFEDHFTHLMIHGLLHLWALTIQRIWRLTPWKPLKSTF